MQGPPGALTPLQPPGQPAYDWLREVEEVSGEQAQAEVGRDQKAATLSSRYHPLPAGPLPEARFHWDESATHRVEAVGGSGVEKLVHINDRCALVFFMVVPFIGECALGKIGARSDLLEHLHDPSRPGDRDKQNDR
jgi:hypothetical protein